VPTAGEGGDSDDDSKGGSDTEEETMTRGLMKKIRKKERERTS
jgi:hypothetical protein